MDSDPMKVQKYGIGLNGKHNIYFVLTKYILTNN